MPWEYRFARHQGLAVYIQSDIIELIRSSACETFPRARATDAGYHLKVQRGDQPDDFKPMPSISKGVEEIRVLVSSGAYRVIYFARRADAVYVLHAPQERHNGRRRKILKLLKDDLGNC